MCVFLFYAFVVCGLDGVRLWSRGSHLLTVLQVDELPVVSFYYHGVTLLGPGSQFALDVDVYMYPGKRYRNVAHMFRTVVDAAFSICR